MRLTTLEWLGVIEVTHPCSLVHSAERHFFVRARARSELRMGIGHVGSVSFQQRRGRSYRRSLTERIHGAQERSPLVLHREASV